MSAGGLLKNQQALVYYGPGATQRGLDPTPGQLVVVLGEGTLSLKQHNTQHIGYTSQFFSK